MQSKSRNGPSNDADDGEVGSDEEGCLNSRQASMKRALEGPHEQPEFGATHEERPTRSTDEEKACGFEVDSDLLGGVHGGELGYDEVGSDLLEDVYVVSSELWPRIVPRGGQSGCGRCWRISTTQTRRGMSRRSRAPMSCG